MVDYEALDEPIFLLVVSALVVLSLLLKALSSRFASVPPSVGYMLLGLLLRVAQNRFAFMTSQAEWTLEFFGQVGVAALLFHVGLRSDVQSLAEQLPRALPVWLSDVVVSAGMASLVAYALGLGLIPALFVGAALSATSVGVAVAVWDDAGRLRSRLGALLLDVAELDDLSAVLLMLTVMTLAPLLHAGGELGPMLATAFTTSGLMLIKVALFAGACWFFATHLEEPITRRLRALERPPDSVLTIVGFGFGVAALAGAFGFSVAVGALFAGLMFSRDQHAVRHEASFTPIYAFFSPFFFIHIGFSLDVAKLTDSLSLGLLLALPAALGKLLGAGLPVVRRAGLRNAAILGVSMIPRAEIALLVVGAGKDMGPWAVPSVVYGAVVFACALCSLTSPALLSNLLRRQSQRGPDAFLDAPQ